MNRENAKGYLPLVQALVDGKVLQVRRDLGNGNRQWFDLDGTCFDRAADQYRIKPEPREVWITEYPNGEIFFHPSQESARVARVQPTGVIRHYREVIE